MDIGALLPAAWPPAATRPAGLPGRAAAAARRAAQGHGVTALPPSTAVVLPPRAVVIGAGGRRGRGRPAPPPPTHVRGGRWQGSAPCLPAPPLCRLQPAAGTGGRHYIPRHGTCLRVGGGGVERVLSVVCVTAAFFVCFFSRGGGSVPVAGAPVCGCAHPLPPVDPRGQRGGGDDGQRGGGGPWEGREGGRGVARCGGPPRRFTGRQCRRRRRRQWQRQQQWYAGGGLRCVWPVLRQAPSVAARRPVWGGPRAVLGSAGRGTPGVGWVRTRGACVVWVAAPAAAVAAPCAVSMSACFADCAVGSMWAAEHRARLPPIYPPREEPGCGTMGRWLYRVQSSPRYHRLPPPFCPRPPAACRRCRGCHHHGTAALPPVPTPQERLLLPPCCATDADGQIRPRRSVHPLT